MKLVCWALALFVIGINIFTIVQYVSNPDNPTPYETWFFVFVGVCGVLYLGFIVRRPLPPPRLASISRSCGKPPTTLHCDNNALQPIHCRVGRLH